MDDFKNVDDLKKELSFDNLKNKSSEKKRKREEQENEEENPAKLKKKQHIESIVSITEDSRVSAVHKTLFFSTFCG